MLLHGLAPGAVFVVSAVLPGGVGMSSSIQVVCPKATVSPLARLGVGSSDPGYTRQIYSISVCYQLPNMCSLK